MCLAIPACVVDVPELARVTVDLGGIRKTIDCSLLGEVRLGEYVIVHAGFAIGRIDPDEATRTLALFAGMSAREQAPVPTA